MKWILVFLLASVPCMLLAQNVGIGTTAPFARLQINHQGNTTIGLQLADSGNFRLGSMKFSTIDHAVGMYVSGNYFSSFNKDHYLHISSDSMQVATFRGDGSVGIGTATPTEKLEVKNPLRSTLKITSGGLVDTTQLLLSNTNGGIGTDFSIKSIREEGLFFSSQSDWGPNNSSNSMVILPGGNVGAGIIPTAKLHINGGVKIQGANTLELGAGVAGKEINAGKIAYNGFGTPALTIVGAGTSVTNRAVYFYAEGGVTFDGPATIGGNTNIGGQLQLSGNHGTTGQVLTSNGTGDPTWENAAYSNSTRFSVSFPSTSEPTAIAYTTLYNLNPTDIAITATSVTINRSGLYHFDGSLSTIYRFTGAEPEFEFVDHSFSADGNSYTLDKSNTGRLLKIGSNFDYHVTSVFSIDLHVTAPAVVSLASSKGFNIGATGSSFGSFSRGGRIAGHLISD